MQTETAVRQKRDELKKQFSYCEQLLWKLYGNMDKTKLRDNMNTMKQEIEILTWVIDDEMPF